MSITREGVFELLKAVKYPGMNRDLVSLGMVKDVEIRDDGVYVFLEVSSSDPQLPQQLDLAVRESLNDAVPGKLEVLTRLVRDESAEAQPAHGQAGDPNQLPKLLTEAKHVIAVASGKGGVGKSAVASNLAVALAKTGDRVGLLDADIYGPSVQLVMGENRRPLVRDNKILPIENFGVSMISIGYLIEEDSAMIWRGPMVMQALTQLMQDVEWPELDTLVVDLPPGTGDAQLTLAQRVQLAGVVVVTTPQEMALIDARKAVTMFRKVNAPILGIVENMSYFICDGCQARHYLFGQGGGAREAERQGVPLLAELPLDPRIRESGDLGRPIVLEESVYAGIYQQMIDKIRGQLSGQ